MKRMSGYYWINKALLSRGILLAGALGCLS